MRSTTSSCNPLLATVKANKHLSLAEKKQIVPGESSSRFGCSGVRYAVPAQTLPQIMALADARNTTVDANPWSVTPSGKGVLSIGSSEILGHLELYVATFAQHVNNALLVEPYESSRDRRSLVDDRVQLDRSGAVSRGLEFYLKRDAGGKFTWWASYALAQVEEDVAAIGVDGELIPFNVAVPGVFDQRHTLYLDLNYRPSPKWHVNAAWQYRSGWPYTNKILQRGTRDDGSVFFFEQVVELYGENYPTFHRLDVRVNRHFDTKRGRVSTFLELINL